jgi:hypothetical protein
MWRVTPSSPTTPLRGLPASPPLDKATAIAQLKAPACSFATPRRLDHAEPVLNPGFSMAASRPPSTSCPTATAAGELNLFPAKPVRTRQIIVEERTAC